MENLLYISLCFLNTISFFTTPMVAGDISHPGHTPCSLDEEDDQDLNGTRSNTFRNAAFMHGCWIFRYSRH